MSEKINNRSLSPADLLASYTARIEAFDGDRRQSIRRIGVTRFGAWVKLQASGLLPLPGPLKGMVKLEPVGTVADEMRKTIIDLQTDFPVLLSDARKRIDLANAAETLVQTAAQRLEDPKPYDKFDSLMNTRVDADPELQPGTQTQALIDYVREMDPADYESRRQARLVDQATGFLDRHGPYIAFSASMMVTAVDILQNLRARYAGALMDKEALGHARATIDHMSRAQRLSALAPEIVGEELRLLIQSLHLIQEAATVVETGDRVDPKKIGELDQAARSITGQAAQLKLI